MSVAEFLKTLEDAKAVARPPGRLVFWRDEVEGGDLSLDEVDAWVKENGGRIRREKAPAFEGRQRGQMAQQPGGMVLMYEVPRTALWPPKS